MAWTQCPGRGVCQRNPEKGLKSKYYSLECELVESEGKMKETWRSGALGSSWGLASDALSLPKSGPAPGPLSPCVLPVQMLAVRVLCLRSRAEVEAVRGLATLALLRQVRSLCSHPSSSLCHSLCLEAVTTPPQEPADMVAREPRHPSKYLLFLWVHVGVAGML